MPFIISPYATKIKVHAKKNHAIAEHLHGGSVESDLKKGGVIAAGCSLRVIGIIKDDLQSDTKKEESKHCERY